jgi:Type II CAAX prenyl endopeptidase Rce1-like
MVSGAMYGREEPSTLTSKPGGWTELALTLPVFLVYQLGVVFLNVRNATDLVTVRLLELVNGDRLTYLELTSGAGLALMFVFGFLGRGQSFRASKIVQIAIEGAAYAIAMGATTSWIVGKVFAGVPARAVDGPFTGIVMALGAGFYEELAFRVILFGLGAKLLVWLFVRQRVDLVGAGPRLGFGGVSIMVLWSLVSAAIFSGMHYVGALGDPFDARSFVARAVLGLALTLVYASRGFAAAVWTHALYDVWVLVM